MYWLSKRTRNDLFLLYCFADRGRPTEELRAVVAERSARIADLRVRLRELPSDVDYPSWKRCESGSEQFVEHELAERNWSHLLDVLGDLLGTGVDAPYSRGGCTCSAASSTRRDRRGSPRWW